MRKSLARDSLAAADRKIGEGPHVVHVRDPLRSFSCSAQENRRTRGKHDWIIAKIPDNPLRLLAQVLVASAV